jgi:hypothetical protein
VRVDYWAISDYFEALFVPTTILRQLVQNKSSYQPEYETTRTEKFSFGGLGEAEKKAGFRI